MNKIKKTIHVVDYGVGNIYNIIHALRYLNVNVIHCQEPNQLINANSIILPGVGAFGDCIQRLKTLQFEPYIREHVRQNKPLLGICVGMQMLLDLSEEFGEHEGLGLIQGTVKNITTLFQEGNLLRIPNVGWRKITPHAEYTNWKGTLFDSLNPGEFLYFVHSYAAFCKDKKHLFAECMYDGIAIPAAITSGNIYGVQFHPEKSGKAGLKILENFINK